MSSLLEKVPEALRQLPQWVLWRYEQRDGAAKPTKVPYTCAGYKASSTNPRDWSSFEYALKMSRRPGFCDGIGFVFTAEDPFCGIDLDNVWPSDAAETPAWAGEILKRFANTYGEASPSDQGYKIWVRARAPRSGKWPVRSGAIEIYDHGRYFAVTGRSNGILTIADHQADVDSLVAYLDEGSRPARSSAPVIPLHIPQGQRHNTLVRIAGSMYRHGMDADVIRDALISTNERRCDPPYEREHIEQIVRSMAGRWTR
jgi:primase-polymerase (primpol)-like protein